MSRFGGISVLRLMLCSRRLNGKQRLERSHENPREAEAATDGRVFIEGGEASRCTNETEARKETGVKRSGGSAVRHDGLLHFYFRFAGGARNRAGLAPRQFLRAEDLHDPNFNLNQKGVASSEELLSSLRARAKSCSSGQRFLLPSV